MTSDTNIVLSKTQLNHNSTQPNITLSWVRHEDDFAYPMLPFGPFFLDFGLDPDFFEEIGLEMVRN